MEKELADIVHRCFRCGWCKFTSDYAEINCPAYLKYRFESFSSGGRMWLINAWLNGEIESDARLAEVLFTCVTCKNCVEACALPKIKDDLVNIFIAARRDLVDQGTIPPTVRDYLKAMNTNGNPYKKPQTDRGKWADGLDIPHYNGCDYLLHVGDVGSYDEVAMKMARSVAALLRDAGVDFGILGEDETSDGNDVKAVGEAGLFEYLAEQNIKKYKELGVKKIITLSPHGFNTFKNDYPELGGDFEVFHYTQVLSSLVKNTIQLGELNAKVTYHDPCYLGRWNTEYSASRIVLGSIPGLKLIEMDRNRKNALCCGGGGGNFFTDMLGSAGVDSPSRTRIREAMETGADILAVACPLCYKMFDDAIKAEGLEGKMQITDLAEIVKMAGML